MKYKGEIKAASLFVGVWTISMIAMSRPSLSAITVGIESSARDSLWAIALILTASVALFNNSFKLFDKAEQVFKNKKGAIDRNHFDEAMTATGKLSAKIMDNAAFSVKLGITMYVITFLRKVPTSVIPRYRPHILHLDRITISMDDLHLDRVAISVEVAIASLIVYVFINQMKTVPLFVDLYRMLSVQSLNDDSPPGRTTPQDAGKALTSDVKSE